MDAATSALPEPWRGLVEDGGDLINIDTLFVQPQITMGYREQDAEESRTHRNPGQWGYHRQRRTERNGRAEGEDYAYDRSHTEAVRCSG
jgi:hypothetical protein